MSIFSDYTTKLNIAFDRKLSAEARTFATLECIFQPISFITFFVAAVFAISRYFGYSMPSKIAYCFPVLLAAAVGYLTNWKTSSGRKACRSSSKSSTSKAGSKRPWTPWMSRNSTAWSTKSPPSTSAPSKSSVTSSAPSPAACYYSQGFSGSFSLRCDAARASNMPNYRLVTCFALAAHLPTQKPLVEMVRGRFLCQPSNLDCARSPKYAILFSGRRILPLL